MAVSANCALDQSTSVITSYSIHYTKLYEIFFFDGVREEPELQRLPEDEATQWRRLWQDYDAVHEAKAALTRALEEAEQGGNAGEISRARHALAIVFV